MTARWWILTIPLDDWTVPTALPAKIGYLKGQQETGANGYRHWQLVARVKQADRMTGVKALFCPTAHLEKTRSEAALAYVWKDDTAVPGTRFELGELKRRGNQVDYGEQWALAEQGRFRDMDKSVAFRYFSSALKIHAYYLEPMDRPGTTTQVYWGKTGLGKTHRAWAQARATGEPVYVKTPSKPWWDGYRGQPNVIIDEFVGKIGVESLLRWLDIRPCTVEIKGSTTALAGVRFWITSNLHPADWYNRVDSERATADQIEALYRRMTITEVTEREPEDIADADAGNVSPDIDA